ncbi:MAG: hypothetical protein U0931_30555 [Vulcanimicrobiota bacterium]
MRRRSLLLALTGLPLSALAQRNPKPAFKGMEIYSWLDGPSWRYALLPGTNRNKFWPELEAAQVDGEELKRRLGQLAVGENVFWMDSCGERRLDLPPEARLAEFRRLCQELEIQLYIPKSVQGVPKANQ